MAKTATPVVAIDKEQDLAITEMEEFKAKTAHYNIIKQGALQLIANASDSPNEITLVALRQDYHISAVIVGSAVSTSYTRPVQETNATATAELVL